MKKIIAFLLIGSIFAIALHDYYVAQFDKHELKQELHCNHLHHADYHLHALLPANVAIDEWREDFGLFTSIKLPPQPSISINPPPPRS